MYLREYAISGDIPEQAEAEYLECVILHGKGMYHPSLIYIYMLYIRGYSIQSLFESIYNKQIYSYLLASYLKGLRIPQYIQRSLYSICRSYALRVLYYTKCRPVEVTDPPSNSLARSSLG